MQGPLEAGKIDIAMAVKKYLVNFPNSNCQHVTFEVLDKVGVDERVNWKTLRAVDSLIVASGLYAKADLFISSEMLLSFARF